MATSDLENPRGHLRLDQWVERLFQPRQIRRTGEDPRGYRDSIDLARGVEDVLPEPSHDKISDTSLVIERVDDRIRTKAGTTALCERAQHGRFPGTDGAGQSDQRGPVGQPAVP